MMNDVKTIYRYFYHGYMVRLMQVVNVRVELAYTQSGDYIGAVDEAEELIVQRGIRPQATNRVFRVCDIGFCEHDQKWYSITRGCLHGFGIGDRAVIIDVNTSFDTGKFTLIDGNIITTLDEARQAAIAFAKAIS